MRFLEYTTTRADGSPGNTIRVSELYAIRHQRKASLYRTDNEALLDFMLEHRAKFMEDKNGTTND